VGSSHPPPVFFRPSDASLPTTDLTYRLVLEVDRAVGDFPRSQRPALGRRGKAAAVDLLEALGAARYGRGPEKQAHLAGASEALDRLRLLLRMATGLRCLSTGALRGALPDGARGRAPARRPAEERCAFAWRIEDRLLDIGDSLAAAMCSPCAAPAGSHPTDSGEKIPVPRLKDRLAQLALEHALQSRASRGGTPASKAWRRGAGIVSLSSSVRTIGSIWRALGRSPGEAAATGHRDGRPRVNQGTASPQPWAISSSASANAVSSARSRASVGGSASTSSPTRRASST